MKTSAECGVRNTECNTRNAALHRSAFRAFRSAFYSALRTPHSALLLALLLLTPGCAWMRWNQRGEMASFGPKVPCRVPPHATAEELVTYLNQNVDKLQGWRASRVSLRANGIRLSADIAVEKSRHLRIVVNSVAGNELDLGCNDDVFWFWAKRSPDRAVMYASHEELDLVRDTLQIPFEPDMLMEALGVAAIPLEGTTLEPGGNRTSRLISNHVLANGKTIRKVITVDTCHGRVLEHSVWDASGRRIAHATFSNHRLDPESGVILAHHIQLEWPQAEVSLAMDLGHVEVNPVGMPEQIWQMPSMPGYPVKNLRDVAMQRGGPQQRPSQLPPEVPITRGLRNETWQARREVEIDESSDLDADERPMYRDDEEDLPEDEAGS